MSTATITPLAKRKRQSNSVPQVPCSVKRRKTEQLAFQQTLENELTFKKRKIEWTLFRQTVENELTKYLNVSSMGKEPSSPETRAEHVALVRFNATHEPGDKKKDGRLESAPLWSGCYLTKSSLEILRSAFFPCRGFSENAQKPALLTKPVSAVVFESPEAEVSKKFSSSSSMENIAILETPKDFLALVARMRTQSQEIASSVEQGILSVQGNAEYGRPFSKDCNVDLKARLKISVKRVHRKSFLISFRFNMVGCEPRSDNGSLSGGFSRLVALSDFTIKKTAIVP